MVVRLNYQTLTRREASQGHYKNITVENNMAVPQSLVVEKITKEEVHALRDLHQGVATERQQQVALYVIINKFSRAQDLLYIPDSFDQTAILNGRAFVGQQILKYINIPVGKIDEILSDEPSE